MIYTVFLMVFNVLSLKMHLTMLVHFMVQLQDSKAAGPDMLFHKAAKST